MKGSPAIRLFVEILLLLCFEPRALRRQGRGSSQRQPLSSSCSHAHPSPSIERRLDRLRGPLRFSLSPLRGHNHKLASKKEVLASLGNVSKLARFNSDSDFQDFQDFKISKISKISEVWTCFVHDDLADLESNSTAQRSRGQTPRGTRQQRPRESLNAPDGVASDRHRKRGLESATSLRTSAAPSFKAN